MTAKPHRTNSDFQLRYFIAGGCHTPDGAWALLYGQKIDIAAKIQHSFAQKLRRDAMIAKARAFLAAHPAAPVYERAEAEADIIEAESAVAVAALNLQAAQDELATIEQLMAELEPQRRYAHLPLLAANEAAQRDEWLGELKRRAENFLVSQGTIPHDQLDTMRCHPDFATKLVPHIRDLTARMKGEADGLSLLLNHAAPIPGIGES